ncbi:MAG: hypothetical protein EA377_12215 [Phycisphaerales bacterium]|nr:MAG: hypothetical protein EA377_12215 [Phycisphaerales bacterium]
MSTQESRDALVEALEKLMHAMTHEHARLLELLEEKRQAVREAQMQKIGELADREREIARRILEMDRHRQELLRRIAPLIGARGDEPLSVSRIAAAVDEPRRSEIEHAAQQLRERVEDVRHASSVVRTAAEVLANHMAGVMQRVNWALSRAGVYGSSGRVAVGAQMDFCVDLKT